MPLFVLMLDVPLDGVEMLAGVFAGDCRDLLMSAAQFLPDVYRGLHAQHPVLKVGERLIQLGFPSFGLGEAIQSLRRGSPAANHPHGDRRHQ